MSTPDPEETEREADHDELLGLILSSGAFTGSPAKNTSTYELVESIISAGFRRLSESEIRRELTVRPNPTMPSDEQLHDWFGSDGGEDWAVKGLRAVWRAGCDAGMVAE